jgi:hypothetical protein
MKASPRTHALLVSALAAVSLAACAAPVAGPGDPNASTSEAATGCVLDSETCPGGGGIGRHRPGGSSGGGGVLTAPAPGPQLYTVAYEGPGFGYTITGLDFGTASGGVYLESNAFPGGPLALQVTSWSDTQITAIVPQATSGYVAQSGVSIGVSNANGPSNVLTTDFHPVSLSVPLPLSAVTRVFCSPNAELTNACPRPTDPGIGGYHLATNVPITQFGPTAVVTGSDYFYLPPLKNGWEYAIVDLGGYGVQPLGGWDGTPTSGLVVLEVDWSTALSYADDLQRGAGNQHPANEIRYDLDVSIRGPQGVPYL